jgi:hypothetical protein
MFVQPQQTSWKQFYSEISTRAHPSIKGTAACYEVREETFMDNIQLGLGLCAANFVLLFELYDKKISAFYRQKLRKLIQKYAANGQKGIVLVPNNPVAIKTLKIKNYQDFLNLL